MTTFMAFKNKLLSFTLIGLMSTLSSSVLAQTISVETLQTAPTIDGSASDWANISATIIPLQNNKSGGKANIASVSLKSGVLGDSVYFLIEWEDSSMDDQHKPYVWEAAKNKYVAGKQREDRLAIQFAMEGDYDVNWMSGKLFTADTWHWKAARSNGLGIAQDKRTIIRSDKAKKAYEGTAINGATIYIQRPSDEGTKLYSTKRYSTKEKDIMPKYVLSDSVSGSVADVKAKGVWSNGKWTLELSRKLKTGNTDDVVFNTGISVAGGIAVFDHSGDDDHSYSNILNFQF